jgi:hypothetical protein
MTSWWLSMTDAFVVTTAPFQHILSRPMIGKYNSSPVLISSYKGTRAQDHTIIFKLKKNHRKYFMSQPENQDESTAVVVPTSNVSKNLNELSPTEFILATENMDPATRAVVEAAKKKQQQQLEDGSGNTETKYPIDLPSPVLLATSMLLAIVSTGTLHVYHLVSCVCLDDNTRRSIINHAGLCSRETFYIVFLMVGSLFQLFGITSTSTTNPSEISASSSSFELGFLSTAIIVLIGTPLTIYMLYAAITKATAETEADDQAFLSGK